MIGFSGTAALLMLLATEPSERTVDRVAALVNGDPITMGEVEDRAGQPPSDPKERAKIFKAALEQAIDERLFDGQAAALQIEIGDAQIDAAIDEIKKRNHFDDKQLDQALEEQGLDREGFRKSVRRNLEGFEILRAKVSSRVKVSDEDLRNYYQKHAKELVADEEVRVRHIFVEIPKGASTAQLAKAQASAEKALKRVRGGEDFGKVAREVSQGPSAAEGGEIGFVRRGTVQPELERAAFALEVGGVSGVVRTKSGFQIVQLEERRGGAARPFEQVKDEIRDRLTNEQVDSYRKQYVAELRKDAVIDIKLPELR
jgi:peptidyl-prolyl cis-trans isomerase SurA